tara:strand:- start:538 stop:1374 length:837 start_codon:yes stop_codon:yes gene_type:complete
MEKIMATVQMSQTLQQQIVKNYNKQLEVAYREQHNVQPAIDVVRYVFEDNSTFKQAVDIEKQWQELRPLLEANYDIEFSRYNNLINDHLLTPINSLGLVCNPNRLIDENLTQIKDWHAPYQEQSWSDDTIEDKKASDNFVEGDIAVQLDNLENFYMPFTTNVEYTKWRSIGYAPNSNVALLITDPQICEMLAPIGAIEAKILVDTDTFSKYLQSYTTLKKFTDEFPSGSTFVPQEYLDKMHKKVVKKTTTFVAPEQIIPDELKAQMKEVILENKLLGT